MFLRRSDQTGKRAARLLMAASVAAAPLAVLAQGVPDIDAKGILNMPETHRLGYGVLGDLEDADVNDSPETSYCFYVAYKKLL